MRKDEAVAPKIKDVLRLKRAFSLVWQSGRGWTLLNLAILIVQGILPLLLLYLTKQVVDAVTIGLTVPDKGVAFGHVLFLIGLMGVITLISFLCRSLTGLVSEMQSQIVTDHVHDIIHAKSIEMDLAYYENPQYYDTLHRAQQETPFRPASIVNGLVQFGQNGISLVAIAGLLFSLHWGIALILFVAIVPGIIVRLKYAHKIYHWKHKRTSTERRALYFHWLLTGDEHAKENRLFGLGSLFKNSFHNLRKKLREERIKIGVKRSVGEFITQTSAAFAVLGSFAFIAYQAVQGSITVGALVMYYQAFQYGQKNLWEILRSLAKLYEDNMFLSCLYEFLALKPSVVEPHHPRPTPKTIRTGIVFDQVSFQYPTGTRKVFEGVNLTIRPGEAVALVGENGAGKTTLIKLMCRLYDPSAGKITIDGINLRDFKISELRRKISVIFQDYAKYHLTAQENIWFGNINFPSDDKRIDAAARFSGADKVINSLPNGYDTILGKWFEHGEELSMGEWQKIALARVFLRDAQIIVLDEPTSALDAQAEYEVFQKFRKLTKGRTAILISHRFSTVRMADRIFVLNNGKIIESGTHNELLHHGGMYARLFQTQAQYYK